MEIILEDKTVTYSSSISTFDIVTEKNATRIYHDVRVISAGLVNVYTRSEIDTMFGNPNRDFVMDIDNIFLA